MREAKNIGVHFDYRETEQTIAPATMEREHRRLLAAVEKELTSSDQPAALITRKAADA